MVRRLVLAFLFLMAAALSAHAAGKDSVVIALRLEPPSLDPTTQAAAAVSELTWQTIFEGLTRVNEAGQVQPSLAEGWESEDAKTYTFKLRQGVTFHDGAPFTSADVKFTFERNAAANSTNKRKQVFANMAAIETPDAQTVRIALKEANGLLPYFLAEAPAAILSPKTAEGDAQKPVGTGPYRFVEWVRGDSLTIEKYPAYRDAAKVAIAKATTRFIADKLAQIAALLAGDADYLTQLAALESVERFKNDPRFQVLTGSTEGETFVSLNNKRAPFDKLPVRQAVNYAIDRKAVIDGVMAGFGHPIASHATTVNPYYIDLTSLYPHDPAKATALLKEAGFPNGLDLVMKLPPQTYARRSGEIVAQQLEAVGMRVAIEPIEWAQWLDIVFKQKNYQLSVIMMPEPLDIFMYANPDYFFQYDNADFRAIMAKAQAASDDSERKTLFQEAQKKLAADAVNAWMFDFPHVGIARAGLKGVWRDLPMPMYDIAAMGWE